MKNYIIIALTALVVILLLNGTATPKKSGYSEVRSKLQTEQCPAGFKELGPVVCVKD